MSRGDYREGVLVYDEENDRMDIRYDLTHYHGGLHCGQVLEYKHKGYYHETRLERGSGWYLVSVPTPKIVGLKVRIRR